MRLRYLTNKMIGRRGCFQICCTIPDHYHFQIRIVVPLFYRIDGVRLATGFRCGLVLIEFKIGACKT